jgi:hypothetical protein
MFDLLYENSSMSYLTNRYMEKKRMKTEIDIIGLTIVLISWRIQHARILASGKEGLNDV